MSAHVNAVQGDQTLNCNETKDYDGFAVTVGIIDENAPQSELEYIGKR